jgi:hypothetical protein
MPASSLFMREIRNLKKREGGWTKGHGGGGGLFNVHYASMELSQGNHLYLMYASKFLINIFIT